MCGAGAPLVISDATEHPRYREYAALLLYGARSYIAVPVRRRSGDLFGVLCALDSEPADINEANVPNFQLLADLIAFEMEAEEERLRHAEELRDVQRTAAFRERFLAILGHDLRSPLQTILLSARVMLQRGELADADARATHRIVSGAERMTRMVGELVDLARARLGGGLTLVRQNLEPVALCTTLVEELRSSHAGRTIDICAGAVGRVCWDPDRITQVLTNLLTNAIHYSPPDTPVRIALSSEDDVVVISVHNLGDPIPPEALASLFEPFQRAEAGAADRAEGLGLGLYIVSEIVRAHGGEVSVSSTRADGTTFTLRLPRGVSDAVRPAG